MRLASLLLLIVLLPGCGKSYPPADFSSAESALLSIENAYRQKDRELILACKDFYLEAKFVVPEKTGRSKEKLDLARKASAMLLEKQWIGYLDQGIPEWNDVEVKITDIEELTEDMVVVTEEIRPPGHDPIPSRLFVGRNDAGEWKVLMDYSEEMADNWMKYYGK